MHLLDMILNQSSPARDCVIAFHCFGRIVSGLSPAALQDVMDNLERDQRDIKTQVKKGCIQPQAEFLEHVLNYIEDIYKTRVQEEKEAQVQLMNRMAAFKKANKNGQFKGISEEQARAVLGGGPVTEFEDFCGL